MGRNRFQNVAGMQPSKLKSPARKFSSTMLALQWGKLLPENSAFTAAAAALKIRSMGRGRGRTRVLFFS